MESNCQNSTSLLTIGQVSDLLKVPIKTVYWWVHRGEIPYLKVGRHLRFEPVRVLDSFRQKTEESVAKPCFPDLLSLNSERADCSLKIGARSTARFRGRNQ
jgi:excisionase family DNA binding protein